MMGDGFVKIYGDFLLDSTLWLEAPEVRLTFLSMLAIADSEGVIDLPGIRVLARKLNLPVDYVESALLVLMAPDPDSRTEVHEGRRILKRENACGWQCVNYEKYREYRGKKAEQSRVRQQRYRDRKTKAEPTVTGATNNAQDAPEDRRQKTEAEIPPNPPGGGDSESPRGLLIAFIEAFGEITGRRDFAKGIDGCTATALQWIRVMRDSVDGDLVAFRAILRARMAEKPEFWSQQGLRYWAETGMNSPVTPPKSAAAVATAHYHRPFPKD